MSQAQIKSLADKALWYGMLFLGTYLPWQIALNPAPDIDLASIRVVIIVLFILYVTGGNSFAKIRQIDSKITLGIVIWFGALAISLFSAQELFWGFKKLIFLINIAIIYPISLWAFDDDSKTTQFIKVFLWSALGASVIALILFFSQFIVGWEAIKTFLVDNIAFLFWGESFGYEVVRNPSWLVNIGGRDYFRAFGLFPDAHTFAIFLGFALPSSIGIYLWENKNKYLVFAGIILITIFFSFSRSSYIGILLGLIFTAAIFRNKIDKNTKILLSIIGILTVIVLLFPVGPISERFYSTFNSSENSNSMRLGYWHQAWDLFLKHPLFGAGLGNFAAEISNRAYYREAINVHNSHLEILAEGGIIAFLGWVLVWLFSFKALIKKIRKKANWLNFAIFWSLVWFAVANFFEIGLYSPQVTTLLFIFLALAQTKYHAPEEPNSKKGESYGFYV
ncbi:MAG: hypothetical protein COU81_01415 [Candidatus Portnoybacteria bacterium CG10_big_fil_rev_8_21_14_0_10_36_7]|uniref:O-antigen ligase-related domain-containing protein n=1 Tax=Candidatus Portnoybacteria bacterium CG10_big_fil_rev_8_21_14_0_10_36_7 TaxID=1974812 RepID=A0A2M8KEG3_9BACT|nr:MAG: hypothetical protein COU81_01415 [Candidatus Portnoybacteria bacterium CG10_big_fil_rev_8_21_14_0_10_36_7]